MEFQKLLWNLLIQLCPCSSGTAHQVSIQMKETTRMIARESKEGFHFFVRFPCVSTSHVPDRCCCATGTTGHQKEPSHHSPCLRCLLPAVCSACRALRSGEPALSVGVLWMVCTKKIKWEILYKKQYLNLMVGSCF